MKFRSLISFSQQLRTNIMFFFVFVIFSSLQSYIFGVILQPQQSELGIWTTQSTFFTCSREQNEKEGTLRWINPNNEEIEDNMNAGVYINRPSDELSALRLFFISPSKREAGKYECQLVKDGEVLSRASFKLHIYKSIEVKDNKDLFVGVEGDTLTITCSAKFDYSGTDSQITWWFNNIRLINGDGQFETKITKSEPKDSQFSIRNNLIIKNLSKENEGIYICRAVTVNQHLSEMKNIEINVRVQFRPHFPANTQRYVWISNTTDISPLKVNVTCIVNADPVVEFTWFTGERKHIDRGILKHKAKVSGTENLSVLTLEYKNLNEILDNSDIDPTGNLRKFICRANNHLGFVETTYELKVGQLPLSPIIANQAYHNGLLTFTLNVTEVEPPIDLYRIEIADKQFVYFNATNENFNNTYEIELDIPNGEHKMKIYARNPVGWSVIPNQSFVLALTLNNAFLAQQYLALIIIGCTLSLVNAF